MRDNHIYGGVVARVPVPLVEDFVLAIVAPRDDNVCVLALRLDVLVVRRLHKALVLLEHALHRAATTADVTEDAAREPGVRVRLDKDAEVDEIALGIAFIAEEREDALEKDDVQVPELLRGAGAAVGGVVVFGDIRHLAVVETPEGVVDEVPVEGGGGIKVKVLGVRQLLGRQVAVETVLGHYPHLGVGKLGLDEIAHRSLPGRRGSCDTDDECWWSIHFLKKPCFALN